MSLWVKIDAGNYPNQYRGVFISRRTDETGLWGLCFENKTLIVYENGTRRYLKVLNDSTWIMISLIVAEGKGYLYINGLFDSSFTYNYMEILGFTYIGCDNLPVTTSQNNRGLRGYLDEISIWSRALTSAEINALYNENNGLEIQL